MKYWRYLPQPLFHQNIHNRVKLYNLLLNYSAYITKYSRCIHGFSDGKVERKSLAFAIRRHARPLTDGGCVGVCQLIRMRKQNSSNHTISSGRKKYILYTRNFHQVCHRHQGIFFRVKVAKLTRHFPQPEIENMAKGHALLDHTVISMGVMMWVGEEDKMWR